MCVTNTVIRRPRAISFPSSTTGTVSQQPTAPKGVSSSSQVHSGRTSSTSPSRRNVYTNNLLSAVASCTNGSGVSIVPEVTSLEQGVQQKPKRPKRKRKPQQPGFTAKHHVRHFVEHNYHDHSHDVDIDLSSPNELLRRRGGFPSTFPLKLHAMLDQIEADGLAHVISWQPHGRAFKIHKPKEFVNEVMPVYFRQTKLTSFQRQLNLYGFQRLTKGSDDRAYYHELFLRGKTFLARKMVRTKVKGTGFKAASSPDDEPNFFAMEPVVIVSPPLSQASDDDDRSDSSTISGEFLLDQQPIFHTVTTHDIPAPTVQSTNLGVISPSTYAPQQMSPQAMNARIQAILGQGSLLLQQHEPAAPTKEDGDPDILDDVLDEVFDDSDGDLCEDDVVLDFVNSWADTGQAAAAVGGGTEDFESDTVFRSFLEKMMAV